ncbi:MAG TPA: YlbF family regulator [Clostridia bacterium]|nr:YlbF family regulator [Clostridiaceae bacterium]HOF26015.1 YlbF family regulator [Clostridia bacterium]HOM33542.1 YlbF family regulator [Clostridia bacterium]HOR89192.1 YlbF family regulator [Clostridia bacterium]HOT70110.1 YlbF family regulator [Clostridia bacterium]
MIFDKVDELSALIEDTKQYDDYLEAEVELENDGHGIDMINAFYDLQQEYIKTYNEGSYDEILAMENVLEMRHTELMNYTTTGNYIRAKEALDELLQQITDRIMSNLGLDTDCDDDCDCDCDECSYGGHIN